MAIITKKKIAVQGSNTFKPLGVGEFSKPIQLNPDLMFPMGLIYAADESTGLPLTGKNLCDISTIANIDGVPNGVPANQGISIVQWGYYDKSWYNVTDYKLQVDLDGLYNLDYAYIWVPEGQENQSVNLYSSVDGTTLVPLVTGFGNISQGKWIKIDFSGAGKGGARYIVIGMNYQSSVITGFVLYGRPQGGVKINKGVKKRRNIGIRSLDRTLGTNAFYFEDPKLMGPVSGITRWYVLPDWFMGDRFRNTGSAYGHTVDDLDFKFDSSHMGSIDQGLQGFKNESTLSMFTLTQSPVAFRPVGTPKPELSKPLNPGFSTTNLAHTTDPFNYTFIARVYWNIAARYGSNPDVDRTFIKLDTGTPQPVRVGLGIMQALEAGNEYDAWWNGAQGYFNAEEMGAYMSAIYDGHKGALGAGFGAKTADPSIKIAMVAIALSDNYGYVRKMLWYWDKTRGKGDYPIDIINFHYYNSSGGSQLNSDGSGIHGLQPEKGDLLKVCKAWVDFRNTYLPSGEVWLTETGYDEHLGGVYSPAKVTQFERSRCKAYWLSRLIIVTQIAGIDVTQQYWFANQGGPRFADYNENEPNTGAFLTSGMVDGVRDSSDWNRTPLMSYWYMAQFRTELTGYTFQHAIMMDGVHQVEETIIEGAISTVWAAAYKNYLTGEGKIVVWLSTDDFLTANVTIRIPESSTVVTSIDEAEIRKGITGVGSTKNASAGKISMSVTECVQFVKTVNLGTPKLEQPVKVKTQVIDASKTLVTWEDNDVNNTTVRVSRSLSQTGGYAVIFQGIRSSASYVDENTGGNDYFYKVESVRPDSVIPDPEPDPDPIPGGDGEAGTLWQTAFDHAFLATQAKNTSGTTALDGQEVALLPDVIGNVDMPYIGRVTPVLSGARPKFYNNLGGYVFLPNETNLCYGSEQVPQTYPRERWFIGTIANYQIYEAFFNNWDTDYLGDRGGQGVRTKNSENFDGDETWFADETIPLNNTFLFREVFYDDYDLINDVARVELWLNGVKINKLLTTYRTNTRTLGLGASTNNSHFGFRALFYKEGSVLSDSVAAQLTQELMAEYKVGQGIAAPYADNLQLNENNGTFTASYIFKPYNGVPEDVSKRKVRWVLMLGVTFGHYIENADGKMSIKQSDYPSYDLFADLRVEITVEDTSGNKFVIPQTKTNH